MAEESITIKRLNDRFGDRIEVLASIDMDTIKVQREDIVDVCRFLRNEDDLDYDLMRDLTCVDYIEETPATRHESSRVLILRSLGDAWKC